MERNVCFMLDAGNRRDRLLSKGWLPTTDNHWARVLKAEGGGYTQKQHSQLWQLCWNWSLVVWTPSCWLLAVSLQFQGHLFPFPWGQFSELWQLMSWLQCGHHVVNFFHVVEISETIGEFTGYGRQYAHHYTNNTARSQHVVYSSWEEPKMSWLCLMAKRLLYLIFLDCFPLFMHFLNISDQTYSLAKVRQKTWGIRTTGSWSISGIQISRGAGRREACRLMVGLMASWPLLSDNSWRYLLLTILCSSLYLIPKAAHEAHKVQRLRYSPNYSASGAKRPQSQTLSSSTMTGKHIWMERFAPTFVPYSKQRCFLASGGFNILLPKVMIFITYASIVLGLLLTIFEQANG